jgi:predicted extracellular nuclease
MTVWINEFHYDNAGTDSGEFIEIAGTAGTNLTGWSIVRYNGNVPGAAVVYGTPTITMTDLVIPDQGNGFGTLSFSLPQDGLQNGTNDGFALIDNNGTVIELLSYEGIFTAAAGTPAAGLASVDVGVSETTTTPIGSSIYRTGTGNTGTDFTWTTTTTATPGAVNAGQSFTGGVAATSVSINDVSIAEGDAGTATLTFTVTRADNAGAFSLDFATANGTATAGSDYVAATGTVSFTAGGALTETIAVTINGDAANEASETFTVALSNLVNTTGTAAITDASGTGTITNDDITLIAIHDIQGASHSSALTGQVVTTRGIVTAVDTNGFYIQTADADIDADVATSQGILIFTSTAPTVAVGDSVNVTGTVTEFTPGGNSSGNLSITQLTSPSVSILSSGNALPTAIILGGGGRTAPTEIIDNDNFATFDPASDGIDFFESLEGMRVTVPTPLVVAPTTSNGELFTVANGGAGATGLSARGTIVTRGSTGDGLNVTNTGAGSDYNPERIQIDGDSFTPGGANSIPLVAAGTVLADVTGIISYGFGNYEVLATSAVTVATPSILTGEVTNLSADADTLTIASYNVLNLDPNDGDGDTDVADGRFTSIALQIVNALGSPDIVALQEIQDNSGSSNDGTVSASVTLQMLVDAITANGGPVYSFIDNTFITNNTNGGEPGGNIRVAYLYDASRVSLVAGSVATTTNAAVDFAGARQPLVATFEFNDENITVINNHFSSKGGSSPLFGAVQPSTNGSAADRLVQAQNVADYVTGLGASAKIVVLGDLNEFTNEESLAPLGVAGLSSLSLTLAETERYSYNFEGNAQELDQVYISAPLASATTLDIVHVNSEFVATASTSSDHDPSVIAINIAAPGPAPFAPGDIAFVGFNADGSDDLAFVTLREIPAGTVILFNDREWTGAGFNTGEGEVTWTASATIAAGTVVTINSFGSTPVSNLGTTSSSSGLSTTSEIVYAYVGVAGTPTAFLAAIANNGFTADGGTLSGTGLVAGTTAIDLSTVDVGADIGSFNGARNGQASYAGFLAQINNAANWLTQNTAADDSIDATAPSLPFSIAGFTLGNAEVQSVGFAGSSISQAEGNAGTTAYTFTVTRTGGTTGALDFAGSFAAGDTDAADFVGGSAPTGFSGTIAAGATSATVTINVAGDLTIEATEGFSLTLTSVSNGAGVATSIQSGIASASGTIVNDDLAPAAFGPGDVAFVGFNSDGNDNLALAALKDLPIGTVLYFSDNEWNGTTWTDFNEGTFALTLTSNVAAGAIITIDTIGTAASTVSNVGTVANVTGGGSNRGLGASGEAVYVYIANPGTPLAPTAFLAAISNDGFTTAGSLTGTGLVAGTSAVDLGSVDAGADIGAFNGARSNQTSFAAYLPVLNNAANWATQDASGDQSIDTVFPDVPFSGTALSLAAAAQTIGFATASLARTVDEGNAGTKAITFTVERSGGTTGQLDFAGSIAAGSTDAADFGGTLPTAFTGSIAAGAATATVTVTISGDTSIETNESFSLTLTGGTNPLTAGVLINGTNATAAATIVNDDFPLAIGGINVYGAAASLAGSTATPAASNDVVLVRLGSIQGTVAGAESIAYEGGKVYSTNIAGNAINVHSVTAAGTLVNEAPISLLGLPSYLTGGVNSVDVKNGIIAVGYENANTALPGFVALFNAADNSLIKTIQVGILPDDVTFSPDGLKLLVANEAEALSALGTISIIDLSGGAANAFVSNTISFASLNGAEAALRDRGLAIAPGQPAAGDIEPEYITISADGTRAYVTLQEVNGVAVIDLTNPAADRPLSIQPLGTVDRNLAGNVLDTSDQDGGINLRNVNIQSLIQPDAIASYTVGGVTYFITANEGDARVNVTDSVRFGSAGYVLDPTLYPNAAALKANAELGRLNVLTTTGDTDGDGDFDIITTLGGRSISIFKQEADGSITKVRETGGEFEAIIAANNPAIFNSNQSVAANSLDTRSDDKGPEPEGVTIGIINGRTYAFVGLERVGGYMVYDVTDPANAIFVSYKPQTADDRGPETSAFVSAADSPTGQALLLSGQEISNTVTLYSVQVQSEGDDVINGGSDGERWSGRGGNDIINGNGGDDVIDGGAGNDALNGGEGSDTASYASARNGVTVRLGLTGGQDTGNGIDTLAGIENLLGSGFNDLLFGDTGDNRIDGGAGNDALFGARGSDTLVNGLGNDLFQAGVGADTFLFDTIDNGAVDVITDFFIAQGDTLVLGAGVTVTGVSTGLVTTAASVNGQVVGNSANALDLVLTLSSAAGTQTLHIVDAYNFASNAYWEAALGVDLSYPRPLPTGGDLLPIA